MELKADIHTHTIASGHAYGTIREMAEAAGRKKLGLLGHSDHAPGIPGTAHPFHFCNFEAIPRNLYGVSIIHGSEVNVLNDGTLSLADRFIGGLDYLIAGIHMNCYWDEGRKKNTDNLISCMKHPKVFFVSHPDSDDAPLDYERLVLAAKEYHVALEVNNSSLEKPLSRPGCVRNYTQMLNLCIRYSVPIIISSDAHDPSQVGSFNKAIELAEAIGISQDLVLSTSVDKVLDFIGFDQSRTRLGAE